MKKSTGYAVVYMIWTILTGIMLFNFIFLQTFSALLISYGSTHPYPSVADLELNEISAFTLLGVLVGWPVSTGPVLFGVLLSMSFIFMGVYKRKWRIAYAFECMGIRRLRA